MKTKPVCALLPMKAHSERVPNKNIRDFNGKPLYAWIIKSLDESQLVSEILIDTDSDQILNESQKYSPKVRTIKRSKELEGDFAAFLDILAHDMEQSNCEVFLQTHSTNPLLSARTIDSALNTYFKSDHYNSLFGATRVRSRLYNSDIVGINHQSSDRLLRTQDLPEIWEENSSIYIFSKSSWAEANGHRIGTKPLPFEVPDLESQDIDEEQDFIIAEALHKAILTGDLNVT